MSGLGSSPNQADGAATAGRLAPGNWRPGVRAALQALIDEQADASRVAVFDLDNTILCRDVGDATFEVLARAGRLDDAWLGHALFAPSEGPPSLPDAWFEHYETLQQPDPTDPGGKLASAYAWVTQLMAGLSPAGVVAGTEQAWAGDGLRRYLPPFPYLEMVDLIGLLATRGVRVYVVSATNVWTVRWVVQNALNPLLAEHHGPAACLPPERVFGMALLLRDARTGQIHTDADLLRSDPEYASLAPSGLARYTLTPHLAPPLTTGAGKVTTVLHRITRGPLWLAAGDSLNDIPLLLHARHRLWIARLERPDLQAPLEQHRTPGEAHTWFVQPTQTRSAPGFTPDP